MIKYFVIPLIIMIGLNIQGIKAQEKIFSDKSFIEKDLADSLDIELKEWLRFSLIDVHDFIFEKEQQVDINAIKDEDTLNTIFDKEGHLPWLSETSPDGLQYIVIMSAAPSSTHFFCLYNLDESGIILSHLTNDYSPTITSWLGKDKVIVGGTIFQDEKEYGYFLEAIDLKNGISRLYTLESQLNEEEKIEPQTEDIPDINKNLR